MGKDYMALIMKRFEEKQKAEQAEKLKKLEGKEPRPVMMKSTDMSKSGLVSIEFN